MEKTGLTLAIASGKGGTGKTTIAVSLAHALASRGERVALLDCDVEEPNDHLFLNPGACEETPVTVPKPVWDADKCTGCGACAQACRFNAMAVVKNKVLIFNEQCHACGVCSFVCPEGALSEALVSIGVVRTPQEPGKFSFADGILSVGEALAPNVIRAVKQHADSAAVTIIDASPGTACPVVEAINGADAVLLVTEPTPFGLHDLKLAVSLALGMGIPTAILVNRSDGSDDTIVRYAGEVGVPIAGQIPFRREYAEAYSRGQVLADVFPDLRQQLLGIFDRMAPTTAPVPAGECMPEPAACQPDLPSGVAVDSTEIAVISGKGGTGKTTVVAAFAHFARHAVLADNDVDAADLHLLLEPTVREIHDSVGSRKARIDTPDCVGCGECAAACHFDAIRFDGPANDVVAQTYRVDPFACEGCGLCAWLCPTDAIGDQQVLNGKWYVSQTDCGPMVHARLGIAQENSGRLVTQVRERAAELAADLGRDLVLGDGPPGTGCPVIASVSGTDLVLIVTEPTVSGVHDMERVLKLARHFGVPAKVIINKADLNLDQAKRIELIATEHDAPVIGSIPFDPTVNDTLKAGRTLADVPNSPAGKAVREIWRQLQQQRRNEP